MIKRKLEKWVTHKLITPKQVDAILAFEQGNKKNVVLIGFIMLAAFCIGLGIISIIASNWDAISGTVKLGALFVVLVASFGATFGMLVKGKNKLYEFFLFLDFLLVGASIGLIAQVFHLHSDYRNGLLAWTVLSALLIPASRHSFLAFLWIPLALNAVKWEIIFRLFDKPTPFLFLMLGISAIFAIFSRQLYSLYKKQMPFLWAVFVWAMILLYGNATGLSIVLQEEYKTWIYSALFSIPFLGVMMTICFKTDHMRWFNFNLFLTGVYLFSLYLVNSSGLLATGVGLIITGTILLVLIALLGVLQKYFKTLKRSA